jgi:hypothetical protein
METLTVTDLSRVSFTIADPIKIGIADAIVAFAAMEQSAEMLIWELTGVSIDDGRLLTRMDARPKLELCRTLSERYGMYPHRNPQSNTEFWVLVTTLTSARNKIVHGVWGTLDGSTPFAASYRPPSDLGTVEADAFPIERLKTFGNGARQVKRYFDAMTQMRRTSPAKFSTPRPLVKPKRQRDRSGKKK